MATIVIGFTVVLEIKTFPGHSRSKNSLSSALSTSWGTFPTKSCWLSGYRIVRRVSTGSPCSPSRTATDRQTDNMTRVEHHCLDSRALTMLETSYLPPLRWRERESKQTPAIWGPPWRCHSTGPEMINVESDFNKAERGCERRDTI